MGDSEKQTPVLRKASSFPNHPHPHNSQVNTTHFAGRLGGNQLFIVDSDDPQYDKLRRDVPDSTPCASWAEIMDPQAFKDRRLWEMAIIEGIGVAMQVWCSGIIGQALVGYANLGQLTIASVVALASLVQFVMISLFIFNLGPSTGGHLNPLITMCTFLVRLSSFARTVLYVFFQCVGAVIGAFLLRASLGLPKEKLAMMPGCWVDNTQITPGEAFGLETVSSFFQLFLAFGLGLNPRNNNTFGPSLGPFLVGLSSALTLFMGGIARPGYLGSSNNPARCLGLNAASGRWVYHYIMWTGDITAVIIHAIVYEIAPPTRRS